MERSSKVMEQEKVILLHVLVHPQLEAGSGEVSKLQIEDETLRDL